MRNFLTFCFILVQSSVINASAKRFETYKPEAVGTYAVHRFHYPDVTSTQDMFDEHKGTVKAKTDVVLITSDSESRGRGMWSRDWVSPEGNIFSTFCVPIDFVTDGINVTHVPLHIGLAMRNTLIELGVSADNLGLRWINNVLYKGRKIAGCIIEITQIKISEKRTHILKIGIGINRELPGEAEIDQPFTDLKHILKDDTPAINTILGSLTANVLAQIDLVKAKSSPIDLYRGCLLNIDEKVDVRTCFANLTKARLPLLDSKDKVMLSDLKYEAEERGLVRITGTFRGVTSDGFLMLDALRNTSSGSPSETESTVLIVFNTGEIVPKPVSDDSPSATTS